ncbi:MAG: signal transduction histidine kinase [Planctomycetota bacterium]|jgi:signal transduction histidine kinase
MIRRISTKWVLTVLAAVVVPFLGFAWYVDVKLADRISNDVVRYYMLRFAADLADRIDDELAERHLDIELWASDPLVLWSIGDDPEDYIPLLEHDLDRFVGRSSGFDLLLVVDREGHCVGASSIDAEGEERALALDHRLRLIDFSDRPWFGSGAAGEGTFVDHHISSLLHSDSQELMASADRKPSDYAVGIAEPVFSTENPSQVLGVIYGVLNWSVIQEDLLDEYRSGKVFSGIGSEIYDSSYSWLWASDCNTIVGHPRTELYGTRVAEEPIGLPQLVAAAAAQNWGMYPEYEFGGVPKQAAFKHCKNSSDGGLGWVVGIGIDDSDIYATVNELNQILIRATVLMLLAVVLGTIVIARRTTRPILEMQAHTRRVATGDLDVRMAVTSNDELGQLARDFNQMIGELSENRRRLVQVEKESAWREMARQVAHEIKNPLTPISLSVNLLERARDESSPEFDEILSRTIGLVQRQVENLRQISQNFYAFAGEHISHPVTSDVRELIDEVLELNQAWAEELSVTTTVVGDGISAHIDPTEFRRVLINVISNALEAMSLGGLLNVEIGHSGGFVRVEIRDTGTGINEEVRKRLFEPYFTTRSHGTGLGLAICKRVMDEMGGKIRLHSVPDSEGGGTRIVLMLPTSEYQD